MRRGRVTLPASTRTAILRAMPGIMRNRNEISLVKLSAVLSEATGKNIRNDYLASNLLGTPYVIDCESGTVVNPKRMK